MVKNSTRITIVNTETVPMSTFPPATPVRVACVCISCFSSNNNNNKFLLSAGVQMPVLDDSVEWCVVDMRCLLCLFT